MGHWVKDCPSEPMVEEKKTSGDANEQSANLAVDGLCSLGDRELGQLYMANDAMASSTSSDVILDCGATSHMFFDRRYFTKYQDAPAGRSISVGDGTDIPIAGYGSVVLRARLPGGYRDVTLHGVKHVPRLTANLVSLGQLEKAGAAGSFGGGHITVHV